jgi:ribosomal-protein-alanine N-acetyltransferase
VGDRPEIGPGLTIREARPADEAFVVDVGTAAFARFGDYAPILEGFLASPHVTCFIAETAGDRAGFALLELPPAAEGLADLVAIAVDPRRRRAGIGRALLARTVAFCEQRGETTLLLLTVADDNDAAIALFRSQGFSMVPGSPGYYAGGQRSRRMAKSLLPRRL